MKLTFDKILSLVIIALAVSFVVLVFGTIKLKLIDFKNPSLPDDVTLEIPDNTTTINPPSPMIMYHTSENGGDMNTDVGM